MWRPVLVLALSCANLALLACGDDPPPPAISSVDVPTEEEEAGVRQAFADYKSAILNKQGHQAANLVSESTLAYFEEVRVAALTAPAEEVKKQRLMKRLMILNLRAMSSAEALEKLDAKGVFGFCVREGLIGSDAGSLKGDRVLVRGNEARLGVISGEQVIPPELGFRVARERGGWKLDVMSVVGADDTPLQRALEKVDPDIDVAMVKVVEKSARRVVGVAIWQPLVK